LNFSAIIADARNAVKKDIKNIWDHPSENAVAARFGGLFGCPSFGDC
jgi:hypothetical protein